MSIKPLSPPRDTAPERPSGRSASKVVTIVLAIVLGVFILLSIAVVGCFALIYG